MTAREEILGRIRSALGTKPTQHHMTERSLSGRAEQRAREINERCETERGSLLERIVAELTKIGARVHQAASAEATLSYIEELASERHATTIVGWDSDLLREIGLPERLAARSIRFITETTEPRFIEVCTGAEMGISGVDYALAETGTLALIAGKGQARSISLLPPVHVAIVKLDQLISDLNDLIALVQYDHEVAGSSLSSAITLITGPSRTADIELTLVVGVHGPQQLHVILLDR